MIMTSLVVKWDILVTAVLAMKEGNTFLQIERFGSNGIRLIINDPFFIFPCEHFAMLVDIFT